ncbi:arylsulfatase [Devosia rhodophyticola]|uniref:Arylsulfatase n=1 Tax=Devosia rhodophyticola TaxID=3026423 RepID=A0ABY7YTU7_9HYPH|nr:arylsulfatase [Devosia rhodophyticola]WDR04803.1 arylsulfatase [Devosia rhodophyticola]
MEATISKPNVIFVITDDQGYGDISYHGNPTLKTPHLDRMARQSVQLDNHHHDPVCSPSRAALMTGRYSTRSGVWHVVEGRHQLDTSATTMADYFAQSDYRTAMFGKWHLGDNYPFAPQHRGFETTIYHGGGGIGELPDYWGNDFFDDVYFHNGEPRQHEGYCTDIFFDEAMDYIEGKKDERFFVYLATNAMHSPFHVPESYAQPFRDQGIPEERARFYGMITNFDDNMGRLFAKLAELGLDENTIVVFTADHGTAAGFDPETGSGFNAGMRGKKGAVYEGGHRVNFFLRAPGYLPFEHKISGLTGHIDVLPTLIDLCKLPVQPNDSFDGVSLVPQILSDEPAPERSLFVHLQPDVPRKWHHCVVMRGNWRLINGIELYDVNTDPGQSTDIASNEPNIVAELRQDYEGWWESLQPALADYVYALVGSPPADPCLLTARDWHPTAGKIPWMQEWVSDPDRNANGFWALDIVVPAHYEIELRRYPRGVAGGLGAQTARLKIGETDQSELLKGDEDCALFNTWLDTGKTTLQAWLSGEKDQAERGPYFVYLTKLEKT